MCELSVVHKEGLLHCACCRVSVVHHNRPIFVILTRLQSLRVNNVVGLILWILFVFVNATRDLERSA